MPSPKKNEKQKDYISRCIPTVMNEGTAKDQKQAAAICYSMWREHKKKSKGEVMAQEVMDNLLKNKSDGQKE